MDFSNTFNHLTRIEQYYRTSCKEIDKRFSHDQEKLTQWRIMQNEALSHAQKEVSVLLEQYSGDEYAQEIIKKIIHNIKKNLQIESQESIEPTAINPHPKAGKYGQYYDDERYQQLLLYCQLAYISEKNGTPEDHALKLSVIFDNLNEALSYIRKNLTQNTFPVYAACLFDLPDVHQCDFSLWKKIIKKNVNDAQFRQLLVKAPELEKILKENIPLKGKKPDRVEITKMKKEIEKLNSKFRILKRKHGSLNPTQKQEYEKLINQLSELNLDLFKLSAGMELKEADLSLLIACNEYYMQQNVKAYKYMLDQGLTKQNYAKFLNLRRIDDNQNIPNIAIDGQDYGYPGHYLMKVPVMDELHAARAACFGKLTNCCQSLSGEAGEPCVIHGLTSPYGGFYVLCKGDLNHPQIDDAVVAQCWAWRSQSDAMVFDSIETAFRSKESKKMICELYEHFGKKLVTENYTHKVACGSFGGISSEVGFNVSQMTQNEKFQDYDGHNDSGSQRVIYDAHFDNLSTADAIKQTLFWLNKDPIYVKQVDQTIQRKLERFSKPWVQSSYISTLINKALLEKRDDVLKLVKANAERHGRLKELEEIILNAERYLRKEVKLEEVLTLVERMSLFPDMTDDHGNTILMNAIKTNQYSNALKLIEIGVDLNVQNSSRKTALNLAIDGNNNQIALKIIAAKVDLNIPDEFGETPLMHAVKINNLEITAKLLERGANVNMKNIYGNTPLMMAAAKSAFEVVRLLLESGAGINERDNLGKTPLMIASGKGAFEIVGLLLERGANVNFKDSYGNTPLMVAASKGTFEVVCLLIEQGANIAETNVTGDSLLTLAIDNDNEDVAFKLIELPTMADMLNNINHLGESALMRASFLGKVELVKALIKHGAEPNLVDSKRQTALMKACTKGSIETVQTLLENGAAINAQDEDGNTPLLIALMNNQYDIARQLIMRGADVNIINTKGLTPLIESVRKGQVEISEMLLDCGVEFNQTDNNENILMIAILNDYPDIAQMLIDRGVKVNIGDDQSTPLIEAAKKGRAKIVLSLIKHGAKIDAKDTEGMTPLIAAIRANSTTVSCTLIEQGADLNIVYKLDDTPLIQAAEKGNLKIVSKLIEHGAGINLKNKLGKTALMKAMQLNHLEVAYHLVALGADLEGVNKLEDILILAVKNGNKEVVTKLIDHGVNMNAKDRNSNTPLMVAASLNKNEIVLALAERGADLKAWNREGKTVWNMISKENSDLSNKLKLIQQNQNISQTSKPVIFSQSDASKVNFKTIEDDHADPQLSTKNPKSFPKG